MENFIKAAAGLNEVYICGIYNDGDIIYPIAGTNIGNYVNMVTIPVLGTPNDVYFPDNHFSGSQCRLIDSRDHWVVEAKHAFGNGPIPYARYSTSAKVLIIRVS